MSTKSIMRIVLAVGLVVVILLSVQILTSESAPSTGPDNHPANYYVGSDWIERHPIATRPANYYIGSDWIERHPAPTQPANYYTGSDWIERHPCQPTP